MNVVVVNQRSINIKFYCVIVYVVLRVHSDATLKQYNMCTVCIFKIKKTVKIFYVLNPSINHIKEINHIRTRIYAWYTNSTSGTTYGLWGRFFP